MRAGKAIENEEYCDDDGSTISKNYALINKTRMIILKKFLKAIKYKRYDYYFMNNSKYHCIAVTRPNT